EHQAIFISNMHIDHMGALTYLQAPIPVYLSRPSYELYQELIKLGIEAPVANLRVLEIEQPLVVGDFTVTGFASDHDVIGALALLVSDGVHYFAHSGDVRLNGPHRQRVEHWAQVFQQQHLDLFLSEATAFSFDTMDENTDASVQPQPLTETSLMPKFKEALHQTRDLIVLNPYLRNIERLNNFNQSAKAVGRQIVWDKNFGQCLEHFYSEQNWLILDRDVNIDQIKQNPQKYVLQNNFEQLSLLENFDHLLYLQSNGEPLGDYDPRMQQLLDFLQAHHFPRVVLSVSVHASQADLLDLAQAVQAKTTVYWHSFHPQKAAAALEKCGLATLLPERNQIYYFS
ncbi:MBL fold metallo-hydrolase, partial [Lactobacillus sp. XV13L]|nr:MBL fold metallo-hydrolase [Lactobacillus sp. XV13L]